MLKQGTLSARVHHMEVRMEGLKAGQCYSVVLSGAFFDRYSNVRDTILPSRLSLVVDGVLRDTAVSTIESLARLPLATPHIAKGIMPPHFFTTQLLPAERPFSSGLDRELSGLCTP